MSKYGIPYMGSKDKIAEKIISFLPSGNRLVDLFGGGFAITECAIYSHKYKQHLYNELNPLLPELIKKAKSGYYNYKRFKPQWISHEEFDKLKDTDGYVKFIWSFSNKGTNYMFGKDIEPYKKSAHEYIVFGRKDEIFQKYFKDVDKYIKTTDIKARRIIFRRYLKAVLERYRKNGQNLQELNQLERLQNLECLERLERLERLQNLECLERLERLQITCGTYLDYEYQEGDVVYCDPPYEGTAEYNNNSSFNHKEFYDWVATRPYVVYFSSYNTISDKRFKMVWAEGKRNLMQGASTSKDGKLMYKYECIYSNEELIKK